MNQYRDGKMVDKTRFVSLARARGKSVLTLIFLRGTISCPLDSAEA